MAASLNGTRLVEDAFEFEEAVDRVKSYIASGLVRLAMRSKQQSRLRLVQSGDDWLPRMTRAGSRDRRMD
jgi:hypothetical protein